MIPNLLDLVTVALLSSTISGIIVYSYLHGITRKTFRILGNVQSLLDLLYERYGEEKDISDRVLIISKSIKDLLWRKQK